MVGNNELRREARSLNSVNNGQHVPPIDGLFGRIDRVVDVRGFAFGLLMTRSVLKINGFVFSLTQIKNAPHLWPIRSSKLSDEMGVSAVGPNRMVIVWVYVSFQ